jgi:hypothetical protein
MMRKSIETTSGTTTDTVMTRTIFVRMDMARCALRYD